MADDAAPTQAQFDAERLRREFERHLPGLTLCHERLGWRLDETPRWRWLKRRWIQAEREAISVIRCGFEQMVGEF